MAALLFTELNEELAQIRADLAHVEAENAKLKENLELNSISLHYNVNRVRELESALEDTITQWSEDIKRLKGYVRIMYCSDTEDEDGGYESDDDYPEPLSVAA